MCLRMKRHLETLPEESRRGDRRSVQHFPSEEHNVEEKERDGEMVLNFSDVESAISLILSRIPGNTSYPRVIFKHQLYPILQNQTEIETEIETLRNNNRIRLLRFPNSLIGIMFQRDYVSDIEKSIAMIQSSTNKGQDQRGKNQEIVSSLQKFICWLSLSTKTSILESDLNITNDDQNPLLIQADLQNIVSQGYLFPYRSSDASGLYYLSHRQVCLSHFLDLSIDNGLEW